MHPAVVAPLLSGNAPFGGVAYPYGAPPAQSQTQPNPPSTPPPPYNSEDKITYSPSQLPPPYPPPPYSVQSPTGLPPPYSAVVSSSAQSAKMPVRSVGLSDAEAKVLDRTRIRQALRNVLIFAATFSGAMFLLAPIILELLEMRQKAKAHLLQEDFKLALRNAMRTADDLSLKWVRRWETMHVDPLVTQRIASHMLEDWDAFQAAKEADPPGIGKEYKGTLKRIKDWGIPLDESLKPLRENLPVFAGVGPSAGKLITLIYHDTLADLQNASRRQDIFLDGDTFRLMQFNAQRYLEASLNNYASILASLSLYPTRNNARADEYRTKLVTLHQAALRRFSEMVR
jgi:hypothetical protein